MHDGEPGAVGVDFEQGAVAAAAAAFRHTVKNAARLCQRAEWAITVVSSTNKRVLHGKSGSVRIDFEDCAVRGGAPPPVMP
jgi:hypothetical protein